MKARTEAKRRTKWSVLKGITSCGTASYPRWQTEESTNESLTSLSAIRRKQCRAPLSSLVPPDGCRRR